MHKFNFLFLILVQVIFVGPLKAKDDVMNDHILNAKQKSLVAIAAFTALGDMENLPKELNTGLDAGLTINEIKEVLVHLYAYCGFPRSIRGLQTFMSVLDERKADGINDEWGAEASKISNENTKYERGKANLEELTGASQDGPKKGYAEFSPEIEVFLKEHLFADIFERDVLTYEEREIVTVSVLISLGGLEPMLRGHMNICLNLGLLSEQLEQVIDIISKKVDEEKAAAAKSVLIEIINR